MRSAVPPYFDALLADHARGAGAAHVHLGHWDDPPSLDAPCPPAEFASAQERLGALLVEMAALSDGQRVLDVGCGFGGVARMAQDAASIDLWGINIDPRQLAICRALSQGRWAAADACRLPFADCAFDRILCVEAIFHFASRKRFLREAARVLRPGGRMVLSDILMRSPGRAAPVALPALEEALRTGYGPWPAPWFSRADLDAAAAQAGLSPAAAVDATANTLPSYRVTAPGGRGRDGAWSAGALLRWLHSRGYVDYACLAYERGAAS